MAILKHIASKNASICDWLLKIMPFMWEQYRRTKQKRKAGGVSESVQGCGAPAVLQMVFQLRCWCFRWQDSVRHVRDLPRKSSKLGENLI